LKKRIEWKSGMKEKVHVAHGDGQDVDWIWGMAVLEARVEASEWF
jgi:hypothetical protein